MVARAKPSLPEELFLERLPSGGWPSWGVVYPSTYEVGSSNLGVQYVCWMLARMGARVVRFFPGSFPRSLEGNLHPLELDVLSFNVSYELELLQALRFLDSSGIPILWRERLDGEYPLVMFAGALASLNPSVLLPFADAVAVGDAEGGLLERLLGAVRERAGSSREELLLALGENPSAIVPLSPRRARPSRREALLGWPSCSLWLSPRSAFGNSLLLELQRGCAFSCPYCPVPRVYGRARFRPLEECLEVLGWARPLIPGPLRVGLLSPEAGCYPWLWELVEGILRMGFGVSFASLRVDTVKDPFFDALRAAGVRTLTLAPETGSRRLRASLGKPFSNERLFEVLRRAKESGIRRAKLYMMVGLPGQEEAFAEEVSFLTELADLCGGLRMPVELSFSTFVPKPFTPLEGAPFWGVERAKAFFEELRRDFMLSTRGGAPLELKLASPRESALEALLSQGDGELALKLYRAWREGAKPGRELWELWGEARSRREWYNLVEPA